MRQTHCLTLTSKRGILRQLVSDCGVCQAFEHASTPQDQQPPYHAFKAIWDTGATASVITPQVVAACGLKPTGMTNVQTAKGVSAALTYLVNIKLPNGIAFEGAVVTLGDLGGGPQVLIGMDIITEGDFSITNKDGRTVMSFRVPSITSVDFVKELQNNQRRSGARGLPGGISTDRKKKGRR
jgi:predicted aspartyl protease